MKENRSFWSFEGSLVIERMSCSKQCLCHRISVSSSQGSQPEAIMIRIEQAFRQQFDNLAISFCRSTYRSRDTTEKAQTKYECISLSFGSRKGSLV
jgi:hypothetical protein